MSELFKVALRQPRGAVASRTRDYMPRKTDTLNHAATASKGRSESHHWRKLDRLLVNWKIRAMQLGRSIVEKQSDVQVCRKSKNGSNQPEADRK